MSGKTWKSQGIFYDIYPSLGIVRVIFLVHVSFSVNLSWLFGKQLFHLLSVNVNFITLHITIAIIYALSIYYLHIFCKYVKWDSGKKWNILTISQGIVRDI